MINRICFSRLLLKIPNKLTFKIINKTYYNFSNLPKPSRFSQQLGLQKQFVQLNKKMQKQQKSTISIYQFIIWGTFCLIGSYIFSALIKPEIRKKIGLGLQLMKLTIKGKNKGQINQIKSLQKVVQVQKQVYKNKRYYDWISYRILQICIQKIDEVNNQKMAQILLQSLQMNIKNTKNSKQNFQLYKNYFQKLKSIKQQNLQNKQQSQSKLTQNQNKNIQKIINYTLEQADLQTIYLVFYLYFKKLVIIGEDDKKMCRQRLHKIKQVIKSKQIKIKEMKENNTDILLQPFQFQCNLEKKWIKFIQKFV